MMKQAFSILLVTIFNCFHLNAQVAVYNLDSNLSDNIGSYDASSNQSLEFANLDGRSFVKLAEQDTIKFPKDLSQAVFSEESFEILFDLKIADNALVTDCCYYPTTLFSNFDEDGGIKLNLMHWPGESYLVFEYFDGIGSSDQVYLTFEKDTKLGDWRTFNLLFDMESDLWRIQLGDKTIQKAIADGFNKTAFKQGMANKQLSISGLENNSELINPTLDIDEMSFFAPASSKKDAINNAFEAMTKDLEGVHVLSEQEKESHVSTIVQNLYFQNYDQVKEQLILYTTTYETLNPPLYEDGTAYQFEYLPPHDRLIQYAQGYVFETQFTPENISSVEGLIFEHSEIAPGAVQPNTARISSASVEINGTYLREIAAELTDQSRVVRPTGYYLAAGNLVTIKVPEQVIDKGLSIIVGAHFRNMDYDYIGYINRFPDISAEYPLNKEEIIVANPFGGGIYVKVPEGTEANTFTMVIENAIQSPYFSWREGSKTDVSDFLDIIANTGAPWADFESDKFMFTIPTEELQGLNNPDEIMTRWDEIMDAIRLVAGRSTTRPRAEYYSFDTRLVTPAYGAGYPLVIPRFEAFRGNDSEGWNPLKVLEYKPNVTLLHEMGHNHLHPTLGYGGDLDQCHFLEAESIVHMLAVSIYDNVYGLSLNDVLKESGVGQKFGFNQAAFDWIITSNFRNNERMYREEDAPLEDPNQLQYQPRSWAKYADVARLFGWEGLASVNGQFYTPGIEQSSKVCEWRPFVVGRDEYIRQASKALGVNMTPLFHFWGINPSDELIEEMETYPQSQKIYNLLLAYQDSVAPKSLEDYMVYHDLFPKDDYQYPRYEKYITEFDTTFATDIQRQFTYLFETYFPSLRAEANIINLSFEEQSGDAIIGDGTIQIEVVNGTDLTALVPMISVSGGASINPANGVVQDFTNPVTYTVTAEDGVTMKDWVVTVTEESASAVVDGNQKTVVSIYPNPTEGLITIESPSNKLSKIRVRSVTGKEVYQSANLNGLNHRFELEGNPGFYIIEVSSATNISQHVIIKR